jgi:hypothetical protein
MITPEEKLLRIVIDMHMKSSGYPVKQVSPTCCGKVIDINDPSVSVVFRDIEVGCREFTVAEPLCPVCGRQIPAEVYINN